MSAQYRDRHRSRSRSPRRRSRSRSRSPKRHQSHQSHSTHHPSHSHHSHRNPSQAAHSSSHSQRTHSPQRSRDRSLSNLQPKTVNPSTNNAPNPMSNQQPSHHDTASAVDSESDQARQKQRQKQIDFGKNTLGYSRYLELVPKNQRKRELALTSHPVTPDLGPRGAKLSKRQFDGLVRKWRRLLHVYDDPTSQAVDVDEDAETRELLEAAALRNFGADDEPTADPEDYQYDYQSTYQPAEYSGAATVAVPTKPGNDDDDDDPDSLWALLNSVDS